jgi:hypothetical protein
LGVIAIPRHNRLVSAIILLAVALALRAADFGNPLEGLDEQYYLLVGDRLLHGAIPYVDIWDRKPFGLFALFAAIRLLGGTGIIQSQIVAAIFAAATAMIVVSIARRYVARLPALLGGIVYLLGLQILWGATARRQYSTTCSSLPPLGCCWTPARCWTGPAT